MKSAHTFNEVRQLHTKYQDRALAIDEEIEALKREKEELAASCDVVSAIYFNVVSGGRNIDVVHTAMKASWSELDEDYASKEHIAATPISRCVDPALWTLFSMKVREENWLSLPERVAKMMTEAVTHNAFCLERAIDKYERFCEEIWDYCEPETDFDEVVERVTRLGPEGVYRDDDNARVFGRDYLFEARLAARACARVRQARARLVELVGKR